MFDDKPRTLSLKDYIIRKQAVKMRITEDIIHAVIDHQFKSLNEAMYNCNSVEISGFGKFVVKPAAVKRELEKLENLLEQQKQKPQTEDNDYKMKLTTDNINYLKRKHESFSHNPGLE